MAHVPTQFPFDPPEQKEMQTSFQPTVLTSTYLRHLYEVLAVFEANRDWSNAAMDTLLDKVAARLPLVHQPEMFLLHAILEELGVDVGSLSDFTTELSDDAFDNSRSAPSNNQAHPFDQKTLSGGVSKSVRTLSPQLANLMTTKEMSDFAMLQLFGQLAEKRIETWGRVIGGRL
jgi:hypothetical protein